MRLTNRFVPSTEWSDARQRRGLWGERFGRPDDSYRFDVIEVRVAASTGYDVAHLEDAWRLDWR